MVSAIRVTLEVLWAIFEQTWWIFAAVYLIAVLRWRAVPWYRVKQAKTLAQVDGLSGEEFELFLKGLYERRGYLVQLTPRTGDYGVDLILTHPQTGLRIAVQAKRYDRRQTVGVKAVQEVYAGKDYYDCSRAIVVTTSYFTENAKQNAKKLGVSLVNRDNLRQALEQLQEG